jgi:hypothetical protein
MCCQFSHSIQRLAIHGFLCLDHCLSQWSTHEGSFIFGSWLYGLRCLRTIVPRASLYLSTMATVTTVAKASFSDSSETLCTACACKWTNKTVRLIQSVQAQGPVLFSFPTARPSTTPTATSFLLGEESTKGSTAIGCLDNPNMLKLERRLVVCILVDPKEAIKAYQGYIYLCYAVTLVFLWRLFCALFMCANLVCCRKSATSPLTLSTGDLQLPKQCAWCLKHCTVHFHIWETGKPWNSMMASKIKLACDLTASFDYSATMVKLYAA